MFHPRGLNSVTSSSIYFSVSLRDWLLKLILWPTAHELPCCCFTGVDPSKNTHSCLKLTLPSYQKWLHSFPDISTWWKVLYRKILCPSWLCPFLLPTASNHKELCVRGSCSLTNAHKNSRRSTSLKDGSRLSWEDPFLLTWVLKYFLFWILNVGLSTISQRLQYIAWIYGNSEYLGRTGATLVFLQ